MELVSVQLYIYTESMTVILCTYMYMLIRRDRMSPIQSDGSYRCVEATSVMYVCYVSKLLVVDAYYIGSQSSQHIHSMAYYTDESGPRVGKAAVCGCLFNHLFGMTGEALVFDL